MARGRMRAVALLVLLMAMGLMAQAPAFAALGSGGTYTSPTYGYTLTYDASWSIPKTVPSQATDTFYLTDGLSSVAVTGETGFNGNAQDCLDTVHRQLSSESGVANVQAANAASSSTTTALDQASDTLAFTPSGGAAINLALHLQCARLGSGPATVLLEAIAPQDADASEAPRIADLFGAVKPGSGAPSTVTAAHPAPALASLLPLGTGATIQVTGAGVNLRSQPALTGAIVTVLPAGTALTVTGPPQSADGYSWAAVRTSDGSTGYIAASLTAPSGTVAPASTTGSTGNTTTSATTGPAVATQPPAAPAPPAQTGNSGCTYTNVDGNQIPCPETAPSAPAGATARCNDGAYSFSQHHSGTCSGHGGVAEWLQ